MITNWRWLILSLLVPVTFLTSITVIGAKEKLNPEELVRLHLESVGSSEALAGRTSSRADGAGTLTFVSRTGQIRGPAVFTSDGRKLRMSMEFGIINYPAEEVCFDGENVDVGYLAPGKRSPLGDFLYQYEEIVGEGLFGGVLSTAWPLLDLDGRQPKLKYEGLKKVEGKKYHTLKYQPKEGGEVTTKLHFEQETFRHVYTIHQIRLRPPGRMSAYQQESRQTLKETFADFRTLGDLTLPIKWSLELSTEAGRTTSVFRWDSDYKGIGFNPEIEPDHFKLNEVK